ncbi:MAG: transglutaminase family protein [Hyphomicrobiales bacterium]|nr:MAG: transglutaminase family protein [Hyphomicrobiales bacterium]
MSIQVTLTHTTRYTYDRRVAMGPQVVRLKPAPHCRTSILSYALKIEPEKHFINWQQDPFGNFLARIVFPERVEQFAVTVDVVADMAIINPFDFFVEEYVKNYPFAYEKSLAQDLAPYLECEKPGPRLAHYLEGIRRAKCDTIDFLCEINRNLQRDIRYLVRMEPGVQAPEETLHLASGSCRDSGWLLVHILRHLGFAARFVSGYLIQLTPDVKALDGPTGTEVDFCDLHAWAEVYIPGAGWIGLDPTSGLLAGEGHIPLAATPHPISAAPITGAHEKAEVAFSFDMGVVRSFERPRVTKPYTEETWGRILSAGDEIDKRLAAGDVRLTMGGEPTFVSAEDMEGAEWNTAAVGPTKRAYADALARRLVDRFAPGGLLHYGQGKWYPGEPLPRWAFALYWRNDGQPLWEDKTLVAREKPEKPATVEDARVFTATLCDQLGLPTDSGIPAYEDTGYFMLVEQKLPVNVDPKDKKTKVEDAAERQRLISLIDNGFDNPVSYVLPIQVWHAADVGRRWVTERWALRRQKLFLVPGDSPAGFRLPLNSLAALPAIDYPHVHPRDPFAEAPPLPERRVLMQRRRAVTLQAPPAPSTQDGAEIAASVRTALAIEPRDGKLCVFMPPVSDAEDYAALLAAIEETARKTSTPVHVEGYSPPSDPRLNVVKVTPDPGVIEVNVQPARTWREAVDITTALYEEAHLTRLGTEKFMLDGKHTGTGGGNHVVIGGATAADSPFLRRPDLLASIVAYWQNHPSLSYLFSGMFIGPTSQAPRVDEARHEALYELEIALSAIPDPGQGYIAPWLVDRIFRNLLVDVTGNTHRAEICIDKLYSPDGPTGRLGLVEFRSFEMPPHARMSLAQQLLIRALIARFWERPYRQKLVRWGTALHDRFMLPHVLWADFADVVADLKAHGLPIALDWFEPFFEFRFPLLGSFHRGNFRFELRQALEPWHVLGEEGVVGGTARYVDSSLERVEAKISGAAGDRYVLTCNGRALPLTDTGTNGEMIAGVRYRAWGPPSALHPHIPPHVPLVFDLVDTWTKRSVAGCRYHVAHPGGRNFSVFPINAYEAEGRRLARFEEGGHTSGALSPAPPRVNGDYPFTLDLRLPA